MSSRASLFTGTRPDACSQIFYPDFRTGRRSNVTLGCLDNQLNVINEIGCIEPFPIYKQTVLIDIVTTRARSHQRPSGPYAGQQASPAPYFLLECDPVESFAAGFLSTCPRQAIHS